MTLEQRVAKLEAFMKDAQKRKLAARVEKIEKALAKPKPKPGHGKNK